MAQAAATSAALGETRKSWEQSAMAATGVGKESRGHDGSWATQQSSVPVAALMRNGGQAPLQHPQRIRLECKRSSTSRHSPARGVYGISGNAMAPDVGGTGALSEYSGHLAGWQPPRARTSNLHSQPGASPVYGYLSDGKTRPYLVAAASEINSSMGAAAGAAVVKAPVRTPAFTAIGQIFKPGNMATYPMQQQTAFSGVNREPSSGTPIFFGTRKFPF